MHKNNFKNLVMKLFFFSLSHSLKTDLQRDASLSSLPIRFFQKRENGRWKK